MNFSKTLTTLCIALALCCSACKDKLIFDLNNIEANGEWGIPVFNGTISVENFFEHLDSTGTLQAGSDGSLKFIIETDMENAVVLKDIVQFGTRTYDTSGVEIITHLPDFDLSQVVQINLNTEDFLLKSCHVKNGILTLNFNINNATFAYTADLTTNQILDANNNPVSLHFSNTQQQQVLDLSNYHIWPNIFGNILFDAHVNIPSVMGLDQISYTSHAEVQDFEIHSAIGQFKAIAHELNTKTKLAFNFDKFYLNVFQLHNAVASIYVRNNICRIDGFLNQLYLSGNNGAYSPLIQSVINFSIPLSPVQYSFIVNADIPTLSYNPNFDSLGIQCMLNINPDGFSAGDISISENSKMDLKLQTELPINISIDNAVYKDTIDNGLYQQFSYNSTQSIEQLTLRVAYTNALPFDLTPNIEFLNSATGQKYPLNMGELHGCYNGIPYQGEPTYYEINPTTTHEIVNADKIIVSFKLNTQGHTVEIKDSQYLRLNMGAKVQYSNINL